MKSITKVFSISSIVLMICVLGIFAAPLKASNNIEEFNLQSDRKVVMHQLEFADAEELADSLRQLLDNKGPVRSPENIVRITADRRTNSIVIYGSEEIQNNAESIIKKLDVDVTESDEAFQNEVFDVRDLAEKMDLNSLATLVIDSRRERLIAASDGSLIVSASPTSITRTKMLLESLRNVHKDDFKVDAGSRIRVVWLVSGLENGSEISDDLKKATAQLAKMGITDLRLAAQSIVQAKPYQNFQIESIADVEGACRFSVQGSLGPASNGIPSLEINISAKSMTVVSDGIPIQTEIGTQISCPVGHTVILGAAPIGSRQSVFVVQILKAE